MRFLVIGLGAAILQGAPLSTQDLDVWFERIDDPRLALAAADAGGFWIPPLERVLASKRATNRPKDLTAIPALEATLLARRGGGGA